MGKNAAMTKAIAWGVSLVLAAGMCPAAALATPEKTYGGGVLLR